MDAKSIRRFGVLIAGLCLLSGCSSIENAHRQKSGMMSQYVCGRYQPVRDELEYVLREPSIFNTSRVNSGDEVMWRLEAGALNCIVGDDERCIQHLTRAEELIDEFDERAMISVRDTTAESTSLLTNPCVLPYRGWCRDRIMIPVYQGS